MIILYYLLIESFDTEAFCNTRGGQIGTLGYPQGHLSRNTHMRLGAKEILFGESGLRTAKTWCPCYGLGADVMPEYLVAAPMSKGTLAPLLIEKAPLLEPKALGIHLPLKIFIAAATCMHSSGIELLRPM